ncbi:MAG: sigma-70 family RNA polymerase sigma factor, partial [Clostridia bacterium]|nr:sigma-70 family RNA polymerase sigma factor [Clostridia bacterium]
MILFFLILWHKLRPFFTPAQSLYYIGNGRSMPPPLTAEEEAKLLEDYPDPKVKEILIERNLRLVVYLARKYESSGTPLEDLVSIGTIGLIKAIHTFRPDKNIKLATYASRCISNEILMYLRKIAPLRSEVSLDDP